MWWIDHSLCLYSLPQNYHSDERKKGKKRHNKPIRTKKTKEASLEWFRTANTDWICTSLNSFCGMNHKWTSNHIFRKSRKKHINQVPVKMERKSSVESKESAGMQNCQGIIGTQYLKQQSWRAGLRGEGVWPPWIWVAERWLPPSQGRWSVHSLDTSDRAKLGFWTHTKEAQSQALLLGKPLKTLPVNSGAIFQDLFPKAQSQVGAPQTSDDSSEETDPNVLSGYREIFPDIDFYGLNFVLLYFPCWSPQTPPAPAQCLQMWWYSEIGPSKRWVT